MLKSGQHRTYLQNRQVWGPGIMRRRIEEKLTAFYHSDEKKALLVTGARQVGKTYVIEETGKKAFANVVTINFLENSAARDLFVDAMNTEAILLRISAVAKTQLIPGRTLVFFDEVQECREIVTAVKFLVEDGRFKYILSGSLLGIELKNIRSMPVGYMDILQMYPMDLREFAEAARVSGRVLSVLEECFLETKPVDALVHGQMMELFRLYLIVGGMPAAVAEYLKSNDLRRVVEVQKSIVTLYKKDIAKYDPQDKLYLEEIFDLIPSELNAKNKRFIMKNLNENFKLSRYENSFIWLKDAGVALPTYCAAEPEAPLMLSRATNLFKLFLDDVGLLASMYMDDIQLRILKREQDINFGAVYENAAAQELTAGGYDLYYYNNRKYGELDFLIEEAGEVIPIEIKSGKVYTRHAALTRIMDNPKYALTKAYVFCNDNLSSDGRIIYAPIYMLMFLKKHELPKEIIYRPNLDALI